jgi:hypothetical protein
MLAGSVVIARAIRSTLADDGAHAAGEDLLERRRLARGFREQEQFLAARQEEIALPQHLIERVAQAGQAKYLLTDVGIEGDGSAFGLDALDRRADEPGDPVGEQRRPHDVHVIGAVDQRLGARRRADQTAGAVLDVEDEVPLAIAAVAHEGAAGHSVRRPLDRRDVGAVCAQALDVERAEVVVPDAAHDPAGLAELGDLIDEDGGRPGGKRADQVDRGPEAVAGLLGHDLDEHLADRDDLLHVKCAPCAVSSSSCRHRR